MRRDCCRPSREVPGTHDGGLNKDAGTTVGVGTLLGIDGGEGDGILVVLSEVEVSGEPTLDATVFPNELNELAAFGIVGMVEPAATVDDVILLKDAETGSIRRGVSEDEDLPSIVGGMVD